MANNVSWSSLMAETHAAVKKLDSLYNRLLREAIQLKSGHGSLQKIENLLDQTLPVTEVDRRLAFHMSFMAASSKRVRDELVSFLFKTRQACLLLLIDGNAIETALSLSNTHKIWVDKDNHYRVALTRGASSRDTLIGGAPSHLIQILGGFEVPHRHNRGRRNYSGQDRAVSPICGRPVMSMEDCQLVLDKLTTAVDKLPASMPENSYLAVLTHGRTVKCIEGGAVSEAIIAPESIIAPEAIIAPEPIVAAPVKLSWADVVDESSSEETPPSTAPRRGNNRRPVNKK